MVGVTKEGTSAATLIDVTRREVERYAGFSHEAKLYPVLDDERHIYAVIVVPNWPRPFPAEIVVLARVVDDKIIIEEDTTDKPLVDALMVNGGIPRDKIVLAYAGEKPPESAES